MPADQPYRAIVLGASSGGMTLIRDLVMKLPADFSLPLLVVLHVGGSPDGIWADLLNEKSQIGVKEADEKESIEPGTVYLAPPNYHLLVETDFTLSLTVDERVNYARPSIDVLFQTAADAYGKSLIGIICTGANSDGAQGLKLIKEKGGLTIVQDPATAEVPSMPEAAIKTSAPDHIFNQSEIADFIIQIHQQQSNQP